MLRALFLALLVLSLLIPLQIPSKGEPARGPYADEIQFIHYLDENVAVQEVKAGNLDLYFFRIPSELVAASRNDPNVRIYESIGGSLSLLVNPAPDPNGLNPFSIPEVRYAMNYLINRQLVSDEILKGFGAPMFSAFNEYDSDYLILIDAIESYGFNYNPQFAQNVIGRALEEHGATRGADSKWHFNGKPIVIKFLIRSDDPRRNTVGELISSQLEKAGFTVLKEFGDLNKAFTVVYGSDPAEQGWHLYTEGWGGRGVFVRYDSTVSAQMYAPWFGNMPGFQIPDAWQYTNETLDEVTQRILVGDFKSKEERDQLLRDAVNMGMKESVRIFIVSQVDPYIASRKFEGIVNDYSAGITSRFTLINGRVPDKDVLRIGVKQIYQGAWNPIGGVRDVYSSRIWLCITDPGTFRNPYTGEVIPIRTPWTVETEGPMGKLTVPPDAVVWNPVEEEWAKVGENSNATSKITYDLVYDSWHHGRMIDKNDILYATYFLFEWGTNEGENDPTVDPEYTSQVEPIIPTLKGIRFLSDSRVEMYVDFWHFDENEIADYAGLWTSMPWEIMAAMEKVVLDGEAAFSKAAADSKNVDWLSLIITSGTEKVKAALQDFKEDSFVPKALKDSISTSDAMARYDASLKWIDDKKHAIISNGPFYFEEYNPQARTITVKAFRESTYPFEVGWWKAFEDAKSATMHNIDVPLFVEKGSALTIPGDIETRANPSEVDLHYFVKDMKGNIIAKGTASPSSDGKFQIILSESDTSKLSTGPNQLKLFAISSEALKPDIYTSNTIGLPS
jgi:peptide/nickel transport system substrate-binding protein